MNGIHRINPISYIPGVSKEGSRWAARMSYQLGLKTVSPFDLSTMKRVAQQKSRFSFIRGIKEFFFPEDNFTLPTLEEYLTAFPPLAKPAHAFAPTFPFPDASLTPSKNLIFQGLPEEVVRLPLSKAALPLMKCLKATLYRNAQGLYYLKLPDGLIENLQSLFAKEGGSLPAHFQLVEGDSPIGAHIPAVLEEETLRSREPLKETGEQFYFAINGIYRHKIQSHPEIDTVWYLSLESPELEALRQRYGLLRKLKGFDFTCLIATKSRPTSTPSPHPSFTINPSNFSA